jgi:mono/diheme cytochrome c family protein
MILRTSNFCFLLSVVPILLSGAGCDYGRMNEQESIRTYETSLPQAPPGTIPVGGGIETVRTSDPDALRNPLPPNPASVERGKQVYGNYCIMCHGPLADGNGTVGQSFAPLPSNLGESPVQGQSDGELFYKISLGSGRHPSLADTVSEEERWAVIRYLRSLKGKS